MKKSIAWILIAILLFTAGCRPKVPEWQEQYDLGVRYLSEGNYEEAILAFSAAIEIDPNVSDHYLYRGDAYTMAARDLAAQEEPDYKKAEDYLNKADADYQKALELDSQKDADISGRLEDVADLKDQIEEEQNRTFFEKQELEEYPVSDYVRNGDSWSYSTTLTFATERWYGYYNGNRALVEYPMLDFDVTVTEGTRNSPEDLSVLADVAWEGNQVWREQGLTVEDYQYQTGAYLVARDKYITEFVAKYIDTKTLSCMVVCNLGHYREEYRSIDGNTSMGMSIGLGMTDRYTGTTFYASNANASSTYTISIGERDYDIFTKAGISGTESEAGMIARFLLWAVVPADYDGAVFLVGPNIVNMPDLGGSNILNLAELPNYDVDRYYLRASAPGVG